MVKSGTTATFKYNSEGLRVQKTVNGTVTNYTLHGKNIVHMTQGGNVLHFWYDANNRPAIVEWNNGTTTTKYAYIHNLQGDIVGIVDTSGNEAVKYTYDSWGKVLSTTGSLAGTLGTIQPFRYRGYVYDVETGLYYLRSRYYNPVRGRFINADGYIQENIFSYCKNTPTNRIDPSGHIDFSQLWDDWLRFLYSDEEELVYARSQGYIKGAVIAFKANKASEVAHKYTNDLFADIYGENNATKKDGTRANAFLHSFWNTIMTLEIGYEAAKNIADAHEKPFSCDPTIHLGIPNYEHCEMDYYNNENGRQIGLIIQQKSNRSLSYDEVAKILYAYAMGPDAYYRITPSGTIRGIDESRPRYYYDVMQLAMH